MDKNIYLVFVVKAVYVNDLTCQRQKEYEV